MLALMDNVGLVLAIHMVFTIASETIFTSICDSLQVACLTPGLDSQCHRPYCFESEIFLLSSASLSWLLPWLSPNWSIKPTISGTCYNLPAYVAPITSIHVSINYNQITGTRSIICMYGV